MDLPISAVSILASGLFLSYFAFRRFLDFRINSKNSANNLYLMASLFVSTAMATYGLLGFTFASIPWFLPYGAIIATIINMVGFSFFFRIPLYVWLAPKTYTICTHIISFYLIILSATLVIAVPESTIDKSGIIHWGFTATQSTLIIILNAIAFTLNIVVLYKNFAHSPDKSALPKLIAIISTFVLTGLGGGYLYFGDNSFLLCVGYFLLLIGCIAIFIGSYVFREKF